MLKNLLERSCFIAMPACWRYDASPIFSVPNNTRHVMWSLCAGLLAPEKIVGVSLFGLTSRLYKFVMQDYPADEWMYQSSWYIALPSAVQKCYSLLYNLQESGGFTSVIDLSQVPGISPALIEQNRGRIICRPRTSQAKQKNGPRT